MPPLLQSFNRRNEMAILDSLKRVTGCFTDAPDPQGGEHTVDQLLTQRTCAMALGYKELNNHGQLRNAESGKSAIPLKRLSIVKLWNGEITGPSISAQRALPACAAQSGNRAHRRMSNLRQAAISCVTLTGDRTHILSRY